MRAGSRGVRPVGRVNAELQTQARADQATVQPGKRSRNYGRHERHERSRAGGIGVVIWRLRYSEVESSRFRPFFQAFRVFRVFRGSTRRPFPGSHTLGETGRRRWQPRETPIPTRSAQKKRPWPECGPRPGIFPATSYLLAAGFFAPRVLSVRLLRNAMICCVSVAVSSLPSCISAILLTACSRPACLPSWK